MTVHGDQHVNANAPATMPGALRVLYRTLLAAQLAGAVIGLAFAPLPAIVDNVWTGAALATLPGYLLGALWLRHRRRAEYVAHRTNVARVGLAAVVFAVAGIVTLHG